MNSKNNSKSISYKRFTVSNFYKNKFKNKNSSNDSGTINKINEQIQNGRNKAIQNMKKATAKKTIRTGLNTVAPGAGEVANNMLNTEKGDKILDKY